MTRRLLALVAVALLVASCSGSEDPDPPTASVAPTSTTERTTSTTEALTPEEEVEAAYLKSWDVYAETMRSLEDAGLEDVYADAALQMVREELERFSSEGTPLVVQVEHDLAAQLVDSTSALVRDRYVNTSYRVDQEERPLDDPNDPGTYLETYQMRKTGGKWRVTRIVRESYQP